ncbi:alpha-L-rhamnosidase C-terminal domain-containing protein [Microbacterium sp. 179-I 1D1 NHS]|uniref:alpha-L-rhamnosidase-related protein n=1 Tax=Microbacterium sp. 179-I 1D1 NHS TaxID=3374298 RepID=UPI003879D346
MTIPLPSSAREAAELNSARRGPAPEEAVEADDTAVWFSEPGGWELGLLGRLVREGFAAARDVGYPDNYGRPSPRLRFRITGASDPIRVRATGVCTVTAGDDGETFVDVDTQGEEPAGVALGPGVAGAVVEVEAPRGGWRPASPGMGTADVPPHLLRNPSVQWPMTLDGDVWSAPVELLGRVVVRTVDDVPPVIWAGESRREAVARTHLEQFLDVGRRVDGAWESVHELGLRYLAVDGAEVESVSVESVAPVTRGAGSFSCSDERLTDIWNAAAHTLLICSQGLIVDGVKRDRMPWMGDLSLGALANAYVTGDAEIVRRGLIALSRHTHGYVNGIVDYTLWWLICLDQSTGLYAFDGLLDSEAERVAEVLDRLTPEVGDDGVLRPRPSADAFDKPVFIDWGVDVRPDADSTALQLLWWRALGSAIRVLGAGRRPEAARWAAVRERLRETIARTGWVADRGVWREYLGGEDDLTAYADAFAVLAGWFAGEAPAAASRRLRSAPATRTPFITAYVLQALAEAGHPEEAVVRIRDLWGGMLDLGATTFWEEFAIPGLDHLEMYGRPFGKSLCHAWAAGPAYLLPQIVLGLRPIADGWASFAVDPRLGDLEWASAIVPTPRGVIEVLATASDLVVHAPEGCTFAFRGRSYSGRQRFSLDRVSG